jgi:hypothetical protein
MNQNISKRNEAMSYPSIKKPVGFSIFPMAAASKSRTTELLTSPPEKKSIV